MVVRYIYALLFLVANIFAYHFLRDSAIVAVMATVIALPLRESCS